MNKAFIILLLSFNCSAFCQSIEKKIFIDTSVCFIRQIDSLNPVHLSQAELSEIEDHLVKAINELYLSQQRYADSVNPKKKKNRYQALQIDIGRYFFQLIPKTNPEGQKVVKIKGDSKDYFITGGTRKKPVFDNQWKKKFINGYEVMDGGSGFIYLIVNLTLKNHGQLTMNGGG